MKNKIPKQLMNPNFRFFLIGRNKKTPIERLWNSSNNYMFFEPKLLEHIKWYDNIGICTGFGGLIVIDFDDLDYQKQKEPLLPKTFTVRTAGKGLHHKYYILKGDMISKIGIDDNPRMMCIGCLGIGEVLRSTTFSKSKWFKCSECGGRKYKYVNNYKKDDRYYKKRVADIQAGKMGVVCPPSKINRKFYSVIDNSPIAEITQDKLAKVFNIQYFKQSRKRNFDIKLEPEKIRKTIELFKLLGIKQTKPRHFKCPFHDMNGEGNLWIADNASIFCFHCESAFRDSSHFALSYNEIYGIK